MSLMRARRLGVSALAALLLLGAAYALTSERAPRVRLLWREGITAGEQASREAAYSLVNGRDRLTEGSLAYDLLDTSRANIRRIVEDPAVADTNDIDRHVFVVEADTDRGEAWTWVAYRLPGLRHTWFRRTIILLLAFAAAVGLRREWLRLARSLRRGARHAARVWNLHRRDPAASRDLFDAIPWQAAPGAAAGGRALVKAAGALLVVIAAGPPVLETWEALALGAAVLALVFGDCRGGWWRVPAAAALVLTAMAIKGTLPRADIAEGHHALFIPSPGAPLEKGLPPEVFASWKAQFDAQYPDPGVVVPNSWRFINAGATSLHATSADAIWRKAQYSRQVDTIDFRSLAEFRGGFANHEKDNFWIGDMTREGMPFYVMYELTRASVGSRLRWRGQVFWERAGGGYDEIRHEQIAERTIQPEDAGRRVYAAFFPERDDTLDFHLVLSPRLRAAWWAEALLTLIGIGAVAAVLVRPRWPAYLRAATIFLVAYYVLIAWYPEPSAERLGRSYLPHGGGNDGLPYEAHGRTMAMLVGSGQVVEALKGVEAVFGSTPGTRYVRMVEKLIFGETNHLYALLLAGVPIVVFYLMRRFVGALPAWAITCAFVLLPLQHLSFLQYFTSGRAGYADWIGAGLFLLGLTVLLYNQPGTPDRKLSHVWVGGAALMAAMCVRPHIGLAVVWVGAAYAWLAWTRRDLRPALAAAAGLALALWVPFHNVYYGGQFYLVTPRERTSMVRISWTDYAQAPADLIQGQETRALEATGLQFGKWVWDPGFAYAPTWSPLLWTTRLLRVSALAVTAWVAFGTFRRRRRAPLELGIIAGASLWAHAAMLLVFGHHQRYLLAWDLSMIVLVVWLVTARAERSTAQPAVVQPHVTAA